MNAERIRDIAAEFSYGGCTSITDVIGAITKALAESEKDVKGLMDNLTDEQRYDIIHEYCTGCGRKDLPCHCQNDE